MSAPLVNHTSASYYEFQQSLDEYVFFSPLTKGGASGRAVKIHKDLFFPFFCVVNPESHDGQSIIRQIENLRTTCTIVRKEPGSGYANNPRESDAHKVRLGKLNNAFHKVLIIKNLHIYYRVSQEVGDTAPTIYVMNIRMVNASTTGLPGLYKETPSPTGDVSLEKLKSANVDGQNVYINDYVQSTQHALIQAQRLINDNKKTVLFYCPALACDELGAFGSKRRSAVTQKTINELADVFKQNQRASQGVNWYVEGEAANLLAEAMKQVPGDLSKHSFRLINPVTNTASLMKNLTGKKAKFEGEFFKYDIRNRASLVMLSSQKDQLAQIVEKLPAAKGYDNITRRYILQSVNDLSLKGNNAISQQAKLNSPTKTFVQLLKVAGVYRR